jgi:hypothetical protein
MQQSLQENFKIQLHDANKKIEVKSFEKVYLIKRDFVFIRIKFRDYIKLIVIHHNVVVLKMNLIYT